MRSLFILIPFIVGGLTILQGGLNRTIGQEVGFTIASLINNASGLFFALLATLALYFIKNGEGMSVPTQFAWWWILPGFFGMLFVLGIPIAFQHLGATTTIIVLVASQILFALVWDYYVLNLTFNSMRLIGVALALVGSVLATL